MLLILIFDHSFLNFHYFLFFTQKICQYLIKLHLELFFYLVVFSRINIKNLNLLKDHVDILIFNASLYHQQNLF